MASSQDEPPEVLVSACASVAPISDIPQPGWIPHLNINGAIQPLNKQTLDTWRQQSGYDEAFQKWMQQTRHAQELISFLHKTIISDKRTWAKVDWHEDIDRFLYMPECVQRLRDDSIHTSNKDIQVMKDHVQLVYAIVYRYLLLRKSLAKLTVCLADVDKKRREFANLHNEYCHIISLVEWGYNYIQTQIIGTDPDSMGITRLELNKIHHRNQAIHTYWNKQQPTFGEKQEAFIKRLGTFNKLFDGVLVEQIGLLQESNPFLENNGEKEMAELLASQLAFAIHNARIFERNILAYCFNQGPCDGWRKEMHMMLKRQSTWRGWVGVLVWKRWMKSVIRRGWI